MKFSNRHEARRAFKEVSKKVVAKIYREIMTCQFAAGEADASHKKGLGLDVLDKAAEKAADESDELSWEVYGTVHYVLSSEIDFPSLVDALYHHYKETGDSVSEMQNSLDMGLISDWDQHVPDGFDAGAYDRLFEDIEVFKETNDDD